MIDNIKAIAAGFSCVDVYKELNKSYPTGNGVDWAVHLQRMGIQTAVVSVVGDDAYGKIMRETLSAEGMDITHLHIEKGDTCRMMMGLKNGTERVHLEEIEGVMKNFALSDADMEYIRGFDYLHTDLFGNVMGRLSEIRRMGVKVVMDFSTFCNDPEYCKDEYFTNVDYAFLSYDKEDDYILQQLKKIHSYGPTTVTATLGEKGSICFDGNTFTRCGIVKTNVLNTVGAGDSYIAGFTYGIMNGWSISECMRKGAEISSEVIGKFEPY